MSRKRFTAEQIITKLREAEVRQSQGASIRELCKQLEITDQTYYRWRRGTSASNGNSGPMSASTIGESQQPVSRRVRLIPGPKIEGEK